VTGIALAGLDHHLISGEKPKKIDQHAPQELPHGRASTMTGRPSAAVGRLENDPCRS
jgi:hypothetical protein